MADIETRDLLPCPFCACLASFECHGSIFHDGARGYRVECAGKCHAMTCYWHTEAEAITAWNTRALSSGEGGEEVSPDNLRWAMLAAFNDRGDPLVSDVELAASILEAAGLTISADAQAGRKAAQEKHAALPQTEEARGGG